MGGSRLAVLIGNGSFPADDPAAAPLLPPLKCPAADVVGLKELLEAAPHGGYSVTPLIDRPHNEARRAIYDCLKKAGPEDQVVIYYSGHGKLDENGNLYLAGSDTDPASLDPTALAAGDVQKYVGESRAAARIVILDCCFSGAVERVFRHGTAKGAIADQARQAFRRLEGRGVFYLTASTDTQTAAEKDQDRYSLLTKHIIDGIRGGGADADDDGAISFSELCAFVQQGIRPEGAQRPLSFTLKAYGDPVVAFTGREALAARRDAIEQEIYELRRMKVLQGADAARILNSIHRPALDDIDGTATVHMIIEALYAARSDPALFLKVVHRFANVAPLPDEPCAVAPPKFDPPVRGAADAAKGGLQAGSDGPTQSTTSWRFRIVGLHQGRPAAWVAGISLVVVGGIAAYWMFYPIGRTAGGPPGSSLATFAGVPAEPKPADTPSNSAVANKAAQPPIKSSGPLLVNPGGTSLVTPNPQSLLVAPAKK